MRLDAQVSKSTINRVKTCNAAYAEKKALAKKWVKSIGIGLSFSPPEVHHSTLSDKDLKPISLLFGVLIVSTSSLCWRVSARLLLGFFSPLLFLSWQISEASAEVRSRLNAEIRVPAMSSIAVMDLDRGSVVFARNEGKVLKPASVLKLATSALAFETLGPDFTFSTEVLVSGVAQSHVNTMYIRGSGDPSLTVENLWLIARRIAQRGVKSIDRLVLDDSRFRNAPARSGQRAYEAGTSALAFNFNSVAFELCPTAVGKPALVSVNPVEFGVEMEGAVNTIAKGTGAYRLDELPVTAAGVNSGVPRYRLGGTLGISARCITVYRSVSDPALYLGTVLRGLLQKEGVRVIHAPQRGVVSSTAKILFTHESKALSQILRDLNHFSTNSTADQILLASAAGYQRSLTRGRVIESVGFEDGIAAMEQYLRKVGIPAESFAIHDGSGLSHDNRFTAAALLKVLANGVSSDIYGTEFEASLAVAGRSGTLRKRRMPGTVRGKTGTLNGVTALAGVVRNAGIGVQNGTRFAFVIIQNGNVPRDQAFRLEERVINILRND